MLLFISISIHPIKPGIHDLHCMLQLFWHSLPCTWLLCCFYLQPCHTQPPGRHWRVLAMQTQTLWPWETLYCHLFPSASGGRKTTFICVKWYFTSTIWPAYLKKNLTTVPVKNLLTPLTFLHWVERYRLPGLHQQTPQRKSLHLHQPQTAGTKGAAQNLSKVNIYWLLVYKFYRRFFCLFQIETMYFWRHLPPSYSPWIVVAGWK